MSNDEKYYAGIEAGGTTWLVAISKGNPENVIDRIEIPTTTPEETISKAKAWLKSKTFDAIGIASFGPINLDPSSPTYGYITTTPKPNWSNTNLIQPFEEWDVPIGFETDVNAPAMMESTKRISKTSSTFPTVCYITLGTGIGVGVSIDGQPIHGFQHPEAGHMFVPLSQNDLDMNFPGYCPYHGPCIEGMAASGAMAKRANVLPSELPQLPSDHVVWDSQAHYLAYLCVNLTLTVSPKAIVIGGGMSKRPGLIEDIIKKFEKFLNNYIEIPNINEYICLSNQEEIGLISSMELARQVLNGSIINGHSKARKKSNS